MSFPNDEVRAAVSGGFSFSCFSNFSLTRDLSSLFALCIFSSCVSSFPSGVPSLSFSPPSDGGVDSSSRTCEPKPCTRLSRRLNLSASSPSRGFLGFRGARPAGGKTHSMLCRIQLEHGCFLSHLTFLRLQVTHDRGFKFEEAAGEVLLEDLWILVSFELILFALSIE